MPESMLCRYCPCEEEAHDESGCRGFDGAGCPCELTRLDCLFLREPMSPLLLAADMARPLEAQLEDLRRNNTRSQRLARAEARRQAYAYEQRRMEARRFQRHARPGAGHGRAVFRLASFGRRRR
jgi:hypothetical protein